jgi:hypothetical protein
MATAAQQGIAASPSGSPLVSHAELFNTAKNGGTPIPYFGGEGAGVAYDPDTGDVYFAENPFVGAGVPQIVVIHSNGTSSVVPPPGPPFSGFGDLTALVFYAGNLYVADGNGYTNSYAGGQPTPLNVIWQYVPSTGAWSQIVTNINNPTGIAFGPAGDLYVASWGDNTVYKYPYISIGSFGSPSPFWTAPDPTAAPYAIAFDQIQEFLYICGFGPENSNGTKVFRVSSNGTSNVFFDSAAADSSAVYFTNGFAEPASLAFDANDYLYVSYYNARKIVRIAPNGTSVAVFPGGGTADDAPNGIAVTPQGDVFTVVLGSSTADGNVALIRIHGMGPSINAAFDFSSTLNSGPWSYGYAGSSGGAFTLLSPSPNMAATDFIASSPSPYGLDFWLTNPPYDPPNLDPDVVHNGGAATLTPFCCAVIPPNGLGLQPGPNGSGVSAHVRWSELFAADYLVFGLWSGLNFESPTNTSVAIASSGGTPPTPLALNSFGGSILTQFGFDTNNGGAGDTVDFNVTAGSNNGVTGLDAIVVQAADSTPLTFSHSALWFGVQAVNTQSPTITTTVKNLNGSNDVTITDFEYVGADLLDFQWLSNGGCRLNQVLAAGTGTCTFPAVFQPTGLGARNAFVLITSTDNVTGQTVTEQIPLVGVGVPNTAVSLVTSSNSVASGGNVTYTATVTPAAAQNVIGSVQFYDGQTPLGTPITVNPALWTALYTQTASSPGPHAITAVFIPGSSALVGISLSTITESVVQASTTTALTANPPTSQTLGSPVTLTATVTPTTSGTPTGTVTFYDGSSNLGTVPLASTGAVLSSTLSLGSHSITATYSGDANFLTSTSAVVGLSVLPPQILQITDNETVTVTDSFLFADVAAAEAINVKDAITVTPLINVAAPVIYFSAGSLGFGSVAAGQTGTQTLTLSDIGEAPLSVTSATLSQGSAFTISQVTCSNGATSLPITLPVGGACILTISYLEPSGAAANDTLIVTDNAALSNVATVSVGTSYTQAISLNGSGVSAPPPPPPSAVVPLVDNESISVTDSSSFPDVFDPEAITVSDQVTIRAYFPMPVLVAINPATGWAGTIVPVTLTGAGLTGATGISVSGSGVTASNIVATNTTVTALLTIAGNAVLGARNVAVTTPGGTSGPVPFTIVAPPPPTLTAIAPNIGFRNTSVPVTLTGTNFTALGITAAVSGTGTDVTVSALTVVNSTTITATFVISSTASLSARSVTVTTPGGQSNTVTFTVMPPTLTSISPNTGAQGTVVPVTITGAGLTGATTVNVPAGGITVSGLTVLNDTQVTATFTIAPNAALTARNVTVTTPSGTSNAITFMVTAPPAPILTSISLPSELRGSPVSVTLTGTNFVTGSNVVISPPATGVSISNVAVGSTTTITATISSTAAAAIGSINVGVTTPGGASNTLPFAITGPALTSISPVSADRGTANLSVVLTGYGLTGTTAINAGNGITVSSLTVAGDTQVTATLNISAGAAAGARNLTITAPGGNSNAVGFTVTVPPSKLFSMTSNTGARGTTETVTLSGISLTGASAVNVTGAGITVSGITVVSDTQINATFTISATAALTARNVTVTTPSGTSTPVTFTVVNPGTPILSSIAPTSGLRGTPATVVLTGSNFTAGSTVNIMAPANGLTVAGVTVVSPTQINATFNTTSGAAIGPRSITVTNPGGTSDPVTYTVLGPVLTSITPPSAPAGQGVAVPVMVFGSGLTGTTAISVSGSGIAVGPITVVSDTQVNTTFTIAAGAAGTARNVSVTAPGGVSNTVAFTVMVPPSPTLASITPSAGVRGMTVAVTLTGNNFIPGQTTVAVNGTGITVSGITVVSSTQITATFTISAAAALTTRSVTVTVAGATTASNPEPFTVQGPTIASISPNSATHPSTGTVAIPVTITGTNLTGATGLTGLGSGVSAAAGSFTVSPTTITVTLNVLSTATTGIKNIGVTTPIGTTNTVPFTVN